LAAHSAFENIRSTKPRKHGFDDDVSASHVYKCHSMAQDLREAMVSVL